MQLVHVCKVCNVDATSLQCWRREIGHFLHQLGLSDKHFQGFVAEIGWHECCSRTNATMMLVQIPLSGRDLERCILHKLL